MAATLAEKPKAVDASEDLTALIQRHSETLSAQLQAHQLSTFSPDAQKEMRHFSPAEAAKLLGITEGYLRQLAAEIPDVSTVTGLKKRSYSAEAIHEIRKFLHAGARGGKRYLPWRADGEALQVVSVMNFKGGSGKTTSTAHLAQHLALHGYRVLAIDLDPQASLSALFGLQSEIDIGPNETIYGAIRYDDEVRPIAEIVRATYIPDLHLIPGNLELMVFEHETPHALLHRKEGDTLFFARIGQALAPIEHMYDVVVIDCPPQLGFLTMAALTTATSVLITVHPQMLDVMSMNQFLKMTGELLDAIAKPGASNQYNWMKYLITRFEPSDGPQNQMVAFLRSIFGEHVLNHPMLKSTAISDAGLTNQTIYEVERSMFTRSTYDRALESMENVNSEIEALLRKAWGRPQ
ncbi:MAG: plasmid partitioning protein RepA [Proteobacteria bacterium]|nr:plasmid partitioning protein RepA [Pseudomonadota bacterium]